MRFVYILTFLLCLFLFFPIPFAQGEEGRDADEEPIDPDIVLPSVILEIEDLSIEVIDAVLPEEDELLPPEREVPLPEQDVMEIKEPSPYITLPDYDMARVPTDESLIAEVVLGAGSVNNILSLVSLYKLGLSPRYKLLFSHETLDGFGFEDAGTGFYIREDSLNAAIKGNLGIMESELSGNYYEVERGLQGQGNYFSHISRFINGTALFSFTPADKFRLFTDLEGSFTSMSLTGATIPDIGVSYPPLEISAHTTVGGELILESFRCGISSEYTYRNLPGGDNFDLHRILANMFFSIELPLTFMVNGNVGYFYTSDGLWLVPFDINLAANPSKTISFRLSGGYRREAYDFSSVWKNFEYTGFTGDFHGYPDNHGWYGDGGMTMNFDNIFILSLGLGISSNTLILRYGDEPDPEPETGLFTLLEIPDVLKGTGELGIRINVAKWLYLNLKTSGYILFEQEIRPWMETVFEGISAKEDGNFGGNFSLLLQTDFTGDIEFPVFDVALFYKISDNMRIIGEGYDLFSPFLENSRIVQGHYISPGIRGTIKVHINF